MGISHSANLEEPAVLPLVCILLELLGISVNNGSKEDIDYYDLYNQCRFLFFGFF